MNLDCVSLVGQYLNVHDAVMWFSVRRRWLRLCYIDGRHWSWRLGFHYPLNDYWLDEYTPSQRFRILWDAEIVGKVNRSSQTRKQLLRRTPNRACCVYILKSYFYSDFAKSLAKLPNHFESPEDDWDMEDANTVIKMLYVLWRDNPKRFGITLQRGDAIQITSVSGYRNMGLYFYDNEGTFIEPEICYEDDYGTVPQRFHWPDFPIQYFKDVIDHNCFCYVDPKYIVPESCVVKEHTRPLYGEVSYGVVYYKLCYVDLLCDDKKITAIWGFDLTLPEMLRSYTRDGILVGEFEEMLGEGPLFT